MTDSAACGCNEYSQLERRSFLRDACRLGAAALISAPAWLPKMAFAADESSGRDLLVCVFLRGGADGLTLCVPHGDAGYYAARRLTAVARPDATSGARAIDLDGFFGLPPALSPLKPHYDAGQLLVVHATGLPDPTRSHFEAMDRMEAASPGSSTVFTGWLGRHLLNAAAPQDVRLRAMTAGQAVAKSLAGAPDAIAMPAIDQFGLVGRPDTIDDREVWLAGVYGGAAEPARTAATNIVATLDLVQQINANGYTPANGASYPNGNWGVGLRTIAQVVKADVGLEVASVDLGGWDTHVNQGSTGGTMNNLMTEFAAGLAAFAADMGDRMSRTVVVVMSEFGRRVEENLSFGTDHGHGNAMFLLGGPVAGGRVLSEWPGLQPEQLDEERDLAITIDYRDVLAEVLAERAGATALDVVFPGHTPTFRGVVS